MSLVDQLESLFQQIEPDLKASTHKYRVHEGAAYEWKPRMAEILRRFEEGMVPSTTRDGISFDHALKNYLKQCFINHLLKGHNKIRKALRG